MSNLDITPHKDKSPENDSALSPNGSSASPFSPAASVGSQSPEPGSDLPVEMLQAGWRKFFSRRENRPYYFNRITNQSLWEPPTSAHPKVRINYIRVNKCS